MSEFRDDTGSLLKQAVQGKAWALGQLFSRHESRLRRMVDIRLDRRLYSRLNPSDVLQEAYIEFSHSLARYFRHPEIPFYVWLRTITERKLLALHRRHLGTRQRDVRRDIRLSTSHGPSTDSVNVTAQLLAPSITPSEAAVRAELRLHVQLALDRLEPIDREILRLRHFEMLSNREAAQVLQLSEAATSNRFVRALKRIKTLLTELSGPDINRYSHLDVT